jgi:hypothetical protein
VHELPVKQQGRQKHGAGCLHLEEQKPDWRLKSAATGHTQAKQPCVRCEYQAADQIKDHRQWRMNQGRSSRTKSWRPKSMAQEIPVLGWGTAVRKEKQMGST